MGLKLSKLYGLTARELTAALARDGFVLDRQRGSHQHYRHADGRRVTVSYHRPGSTFAPKTIKSMIEDQAQWSEEDLVRLGLLR